MQQSLAPLDAAVLGAGHGEDAQRVVVEDEAVRVVVDDDDAPPPGEVHQPFVQLRRGGRAGGHVGIVGPHQADAARVHCLQPVPVGHPAVLFLQVVGDDVRAQQSAERGVRGVARVGHQHLVARVDEGQRDVQDAFLRADERLDFRLRVQADAVPAAVPVGKGLPQFGYAHVGHVAVAVGVVGGLAQGAYRLFRRRHVRAADAQADDVQPLGVHLGHLLQLAREVVFAHACQAVGGLITRSS